MSYMKDGTSDINRRIAERIRDLRATGGLSLDALAGRSGVSRSMISVIERGVSSPTAAVLEKLALALGVTLPALFDAPAKANKPPQGPIARRENQPQWQDPDSGYIRRNVSPPGVPQPMLIVEVQFPAGARVAFDNAPRGWRVCQQIWVLKGKMDITVGEDRHQLGEGDCLAMELGRPTMFHNPTQKLARYAVVIEAAPRRRNGAA